MGELDTYGSLFIGLLIAASLYGITNIQSAMYFHWYPRDCVRNKLSVCWLWLLDTAHLAFYAHMVYHYLVNDYSDPLARLYTVWSFKAEIVTQAILTISVETLYAIRIFVLAALVDTIETKGPLVRIIMPLLVGVSVLIAYGASAVLSYEIMQFDTWAVTFSARYHWVTYMPLSVAAGVDVVIVASLCYLLSYCRTGYYSMAQDGLLYQPVDAIHGQHRHDHSDLRDNKYHIDCKPTGEVWRAALCRLRARKALCQLFLSDAQRAQHPAYWRD
ncbi:hypothetical protein BKA93DRAFT_127178 [Sparassis latifolia]